jgi:hypothetical protein
VFGNLILQKIFGPKKEEVTGLWRKLGINFALYILHHSPNIIRIIESKEMSQAGHVARMCKREMYTTVWSENLKGRN